MKANSLTIATTTASCAIMVVFISILLAGSVKCDRLVKRDLPGAGIVAQLVSNIKKASVGGARYINDLALSIPFTKAVLIGGALVSLFFLFLRILVVLGPILVLGAIARESSTDATDFLKMLIEFYNQIVEAMEEGAASGSSTGSH